MPAAPESNSDHSRDELLSSLHRVFRDWSIPEQIVSGVQFLDDGCTYAIQFYECLRDKGWPDVTAKIIVCGFPIPLMSDRVFSYCLPPLFLVALGDQECDGMVIWSLVDQIAPPTRRGDKPKLGLELELFSDAQLAFIRASMSFFRATRFDDRPRIQRRIDRAIPFISRTPPAA